MQHTLTASLLVCLSEKGFSLDELVGKLREVLEQQAHGKILQMILLLVEETLRLKVMGKEEVPVACECGCTAFVLNGHQKSRRIRTSLGDLRLPALVRVKCTHCGKTHTPLLRFLGIERHQSKTSELEQQAIEQAVADSYRRAAGRLEQTTGVRTPHSTLHGWVLDTKADQMDLPPDAMGALPATVVADGTKYKGAGAVRGDIKALIGVTAAGELVPLGTWTSGESWRQVADDLTRRSIRFPAGTVLVADAESGLAEWLAEHVNLYQRCHWHTIRDLYYAMWLAGQGFHKAAQYLNRSRRYMFSYLRRWLQFGIACPRASSLIERFFRELRRRIKKLGYNWKAAGVGKITRIILKKYTRPEDWKKYWQERMRLTSSVHIFFRILQAT